MTTESQTMLKELMERLDDPTTNNDEIMGRLMYIKGLVQRSIDVHQSIVERAKNSVIKGGSGITFYEYVDGLWCRQYIMEWLIKFEMETNTEIVFDGVDFDDLESGGFFILTIHNWNLYCNNVYSLLENFEQESGTRKTILRGLEITRKALGL